MAYKNFSPEQLHEVIVERDSQLKGALQTVDELRKERDHYRSRYEELLATDDWMAVAGTRLNHIHELEFQLDHLKKQLPCVKTQGWLSPDEAKRLEVEAASMREACESAKLTCDFLREEADFSFETDEESERVFTPIAKTHMAVCKALSTTAGQDLLDRLERYEKAFAMNTPWPITEVLETAQVWIDHLALIHNCDHHGWERAKECRDQISNRLMDAREALKGPK